MFRLQIIDASARHLFQLVKWSFTLSLRFSTRLVRPPRTKQTKQAKYVFSLEFGVAVIIAPANSVFEYRKSVCNCPALVLFLVLFSMNGNCVCYQSTNNCCMCE